MELFFKGGPIMYLILLCSITIITVFINKAIHLHRAQIDTQEFLSGLRNELMAKRFTEAVGICDDAPGPVPSILKAGITHHEEGKIGMEAAMEKISTFEVARLEKGIPLLATMAVISPLLGFLGTVLGIITTFQAMEAHGGLISSPELAKGIWQALLTTAFGLSSAIPANLAYNYLVSKVQRIIRDMEASAADLIGIMCIG
jgi:biopolymer transport protein ExbB